MKKVLISLLLLVTLCLGFVSCNVAGNPSGNDNNNNNPVNSEVNVEGLTYDGSAVEIKFYHTMGANLRAVLDEYIVKFNELYPNITITHSQEGGYDDVREKISTELTVGNQPNIAYCYPDHVALYNLAGAVATLDKFIDSKVEVTDAKGNKTIVGFTDEQKADFIDAYYSEGAQFGDGKMYTLPMSKSTEVLYYNKTFFEQNGLTVPTTWDEMEAVCKKILDIDSKCVPLGYDSEANWFITMCEQSKSPYTSAEEGNHFLFDNATNHAFVKRFSEWHSKGYVTTQEIYGAYTSGLFVEQGAGKTRSYMSIGSSAGATHQRPKADAETGEYPFEVGIATIPQLDASNKKVISQGPSLCIFNGATEQETIASWLFVKFLTTNVEFQAKFGMTSGYVPVIESVNDASLATYTEQSNADGTTVRVPANAVAAYIDFIANANGGDNIAALSAKVCLEQKDAYYVSPAFNGSSEARDQVGALLQKCMTEYKGTKDEERDKMIADAFADAVEECEYMS